MPNKCSTITFINEEWHESKSRKIRPLPVLGLTRKKIKNYYRPALRVIWSWPPYNRTCWFLVIDKVAPGKMICSYIFGKQNLKLRTVECNSSHNRVICDSSLSQVDAFWSHSHRFIDMTNHQNHLGNFIEISSDRKQRSEFCHKKVSFR